MNETELLLNRVLKLEKRVRNMKLLATVVVIVIAALGLMGQVSAPPRVPMTINQLDELQTLPRGLKLGAPPSRTRSVRTRSSLWMRKGRTAHRW